ncbi:MAG TPA: class I SAM-dependent methyltransferase, partial [Acidimicrobiales bacterium]|nr:class I SAM-dependent methyltransferase [Acidimicrobiales bacterium]
MTDPSVTEGARRARYGIDAPIVPAALGVAAVVFLAAGVVSGGIAFVVIGAIFAIETAVFLYATLRGKFVVWDRLLDGLALQGDEQMADLGCGRGAVLIAAARRLDTGTVHGVDVWRSVDQSGNDESTTRANVEAEEVTDRVELHTADLRELPLPDAGVDVVLSSIAIHNLREVSDRARAIDEAIRVLAPGGRLVIADIRATAEYARRLRAAGLDDVGVSNAGPGFWFSGPWQGVKVVTATKPP